MAESNRYLRVAKAVHEQHFSPKDTDVQVGDFVFVQTAPPPTDPRVLLQRADGLMLDADGWPQSSSDSQVWDTIYEGWFDCNYLPAMKFLCNLYGHNIVDDQCGIPEHRFCTYCESGDPEFTTGDDGE